MKKNHYLSKLLLVVSFICFTIAGIALSIPQNNNMGVYASNPGGWRWYQIIDDNHTEEDLPAAVVGEDYSVTIAYDNCDMFDCAYSFNGDNPVFVDDDNNLSIMGYEVTILGKPTYAGSYKVVATASGSTANYNLVVKNKVEYKANDATEGSVPVDNNTYLYNADYTALENPNNLKRTGYTFKGWSLTNGGDALTSSFKIPKEKVILYAVWEEETSYTITYNLDGGQNHADNPATCSSKGTVELKNPTKEGYEFDGWFTDADFTGSPITQISNPTNNISIFAKFTRVHIFVFKNGVWTGDTEVEFNKGDRIKATNNHVDEFGSITAPGVYISDTYEDGNLSMPNSGETITHTLENSIYYVTINSKEYSLFIHDIKITIAYNISSADVGVVQQDFGTYAVNDVVNLKSKDGISKIGYNNLGWNTTENATSALSSYTVSLDDADKTTGVITMYPVFDAIKHTCNNITFNTPLTTSYKGGELAVDEDTGVGLYYLYSDITLTSEMCIASHKTVKLCLNGNVLNLGGLYIHNYGNLYIYDCDTETVRYFSQGSVVNCYNVYSKTQTENSVSITGGVITCGNGELGSAIVNSKELNIYGGNFIGNNSESGGTIYNSGKALIKNCTIKYNVGKNGGGVYGGDGSRTTIISTSITNNTVTTNGGGIYLYYNADCLIAGTKITMQDGSTKNVENVKEGEYVRTFDHETGKISSKKVYLAYKGEEKENAFILNFTNGISVGVVDKHDLFEKSTLKYVTISFSNAKTFVGKYFYNANSARWEKLLSISYPSQKYEFYSLYTANHLNCIANDMLTLADDVDYLFNIYEFDSNLKINQQKAQEDINKYGLFTYEQAKQYDENLEEECYDAYVMKNLNIAIGKGFITFEEAIELKAATERYINSNVAQPQLSMGIEKIAGDTGSSEITATTYANLFIGGAILILGDNVNISNNKAKSADDNVYMLKENGSDGSYIAIIKDSTNINIGITMDSPGEFAVHYIDTTEATKFPNTNYKTSFTSDSKKYGVAEKNYGDIYTFELVELKVVYDENAQATTGEIPESVKYSTGDTVTIVGKGNLAREGYAFMGWNTSENGSGTTYKENDTFTMGTEIVNLYAVWKKIIKTEPTKGNDYEVAVDDDFKDDATYKWYSVKKVDGDLSSVSGYAENIDVDDNGTGYWQTSDEDCDLFKLVNLPIGTKINFVLSSPESCKVSAFGEILTELGEYCIEYTGDPYFSVVENPAYDIIVNYVTYSFETKDKELSGETSAKLGSTALDNKTYFCEVSYKGDVAYTNKLTPVEISFESETLSSGSVPSVMYKLEGRSITLPAVGTMTITNYKFIGWKINTTKYNAESSYTVGNSDVKFTANWEEKKDATNNTENVSLSYDTTDHCNYTEVKSCIKIVDENKKALTATKESYSVDGINYYTASDFPWDEIEAKVVGNYTIYYQFEFADYKNVGGSFTLTIKKAKVALPTAESNLVYNGNEQTGVVLPENAKYTLESNKATNAGVYKAYATLDDTYNYEWDLETPTSTYQMISWSIGRFIVVKGKITLCEDDFTYNGKDQLESLTATYVNLYNQTIDLNIAVSYLVTPYYTGSSSKTGYAPQNKMMPVFENAGKYDVIFGFKTDAESNNYCFITDELGTSYYRTNYTIKQYVVTTISCPEDDFTFNWEDQIYSVSAKYKNALGNDVNLGTIKCRLDDEDTTCDLEFYYAGKYDVEYVFITDTEKNNYIFENSQTSYKTVYNIKKATPTIKVVNIALYEKDYDEKELKLSDLGVCAVSYLNQSINYDESDIVRSCDDTILDVGTYTVTYTYLGSYNFNSCYITFEYTVNPQRVNEITFYDSSLEFNGEEQTVAFVNFNNNIMSVGVESAISATNCGSYDVYVKLDSNHIWQSNGTDTLKMTWRIHKLILEPEFPSIVDDTIELTYGEELVLPEYVFDEKWAKDIQFKEYTYAFIDTTTYDETVVSFEDVKDVGTYIVLYSFTTTNSNLRIEDGLVWIEINKGQAEITVDKTQIISTYGQTVTLPTAVSNFGTPVCDKTASDLVNVGTYTITYTVSETDNYYGATETINLTINKLAVNEPTVNGIYVYNGEEQKIVLDGYENYMTTTDSLTQTEIGIYTITFALDNNHEWANGSDGVITWEIRKKEIEPNNNEQNEEKNVIVESNNGFTSDITVVVEITIETEIESKELTVDYYNISKKDIKLSNNEKVGVVFDVKLYRTINGNKTMIQPEDIAPGTKIKVKMLIPHNIELSKITRILHVHSAEDIESIKFNEEEVDEFGYYEIEVSNLSEFAFIYEKDCINHWFLLALLVALFGFVAIIWAGLKIRNFKNEVGKLNFIPVIGFAIHFILLVVLSIFSRCLLCIIFGALNLLALVLFVIVYLSFKDKKEGKTEQNNGGITLKEAIAQAKIVANVKLSMSKKAIADFLDETYKKEVKTNRRNNYIASGILPLADTHYKVVDGNKTCFVYVYELKDGQVFMLIKTTQKLAEKIKKEHANLTKSAFPKSKDNDWYTMIIDESYKNNEQIFDILKEVYKEI